MVKRHVLPRVPELVLTGSTLHRPDTEWLLCAAIKSNSAFSKAFTVEVVVVPLYDPKDHVGWLVGQRLPRLRDARSEVWWKPDSQGESVIGDDIASRLRADALPFWQRVGDLRSFARECRGRRTFRIDPNYLTAVAGAAVIRRDERSVAEAFDAVGALRPTRDWEQEQATRLRELQDAWNRDADEAIALLRERRDYTASRLGVP